VLTCGVDVQDNRLEYEIVGWARDKISYGIKYGVLMGDPGRPDVWKMLDDVLFSNYKRADGLEMQIMTTCIDSGGHHTQEVYEYCKRREMRRVWAIKGQGGSGVPYIQRPTRRNKAGAWLFMIGVDVGKDTMASRLKTNFADEAGFCHFPMEPDRGYDEQYFNGLTAEKRNIRTISGRIVINWVKKYEGIRNEPFDLRNYATAAFEILNPNLDRLYERMNNGSKGKEPKKRTGKVSKGISVY
jgi:phage terminase large subunit GpA-like protein